MIDRSAQIIANLRAEVRLHKERADELTEQLLRIRDAVGVACALAEVATAVVGSISKMREAHEERCGNGDTQA